MTAGKNDWIAYWNQDELWGQVKLWDLNAAVFLRRAKKVLEFKKDDDVLDIGSGPGVLAKQLSSAVRSVTAVDAAPHFVEMARAHCRDISNVTTAALDGDYTDLTVLKRRFSLFLCISVVQYYNNVGEIEALVRSAQKIALPGARMLIADLNLKRGKTGFLWDALCSVLQSLREGYFPILLRMAWKRWCTPSDYRQTTSSTRLLEFDREEIAVLVARLGFKTEILPKSLSIYANRPSLLIHF